MRRSLRFAVFALLIFLPLVAAKRRAVLPAAPQISALDPLRSFAITDVGILDGFSFERVMTAVTAGTETSPLSLYQHWFDTQNPRPGIGLDMPHCDDFVTDGQPSFNGFARRCPTPEGALAQTNPFTPAQYQPIGIINRFDQAPADGANCGQYRLIFARFGPAPLHIIFEGTLPNPSPAQGLAACRPVAQFWADLSGVASLSERRARLEAFFFQGLPGFEPVVQAEHYRGAGGVRTLQRTSATASVRMYQFRTELRCGGDSCRLVMVPDALENTTSSAMFAAATSERTTAFQSVFLTQAASLAVPDVNLYSLQLPASALLAEAESPSATSDYKTQFLIAQSDPAGRDFKARIGAELLRAGSTIAPEEVVVRADTQSCLGCHILTTDIGGGLTFPRSFGASHVSDEVSRMTDGDGGPKSRFGISPALSDVFLPHRMQILTDYLASGKAPVHAN